MSHLLEGSGLERARRGLGCLALAVALAGALSACHDNFSAATAADADTCYRLPTGSTAKKAVLSGDDENLETCAMHVEGYRLQHGLPSAVGYYEDHFIYNSTKGITAAAAQGDIRYSVYTKAEQADLDTKLRILIRRADASGNSTVMQNAAGD